MLVLVVVCDTGHAVSFGRPGVREKGSELRALIWENDDVIGRSLRSAALERDRMVLHVPSYLLTTIPA